MSAKVLIWSHERTRYWMPNAMGYTADPKEAGRYSLEKALEISGKAGRDKHGAPFDSLVPESIADQPERES
jgi:hypothetical protein